MLAFPLALWLGAYLLPDACRSGSEDALVFPPRRFWWGTPPRPESSLSPAMTKRKGKKWRHLTTDGSRVSNRFSHRDFLAGQTGIASPITLA
jgi:hypothetical protein